MGNKFLPVPAQAEADLRIISYWNYKPNAMIYRNLFKE